MVLDTTYYNKEHKTLLNDFVGHPYSLFEALKLGGVGSKRMIIKEVSPNLNSLINTVSDLNYANIEMRKKGILIRINKGLQNFTWAIPFYHLVLFKTSATSIHAQGKFIRFQNSRTFKENTSFFRILMEKKLAYEEQYKLPVL